MIIIIRNSARSYFSMGWMHSRLPLSFFLHCPLLRPPALHSAAPRDLSPLYITVRSPPASTTHPHLTATKRRGFTSKLEKKKREFGFQHNFEFCQVGLFYKSVRGSTFDIFLARVRPADATHAQITFPAQKLCPVPEHEITFGGEKLCV